MIHVCSIVTLNHVDKALAMFNSMLEYQECFLHLLIVDGQPNHTLSFKNVKIYHLEQLANHPTCGRAIRQIMAKHGRPPIEAPSIISQRDYLRWALKPVFVLSLIEYETVVYCDCDLYFYNDFKFLVDDGSKHSISLSPHWRTIYHSTNDEWRYNFRHGLYNGGFFIATKEGTPILEWWSDMCATECSADNPDTYVDQRYLDVVPLYFDNVCVIHHKGCNVAAWNRQYLERQTTNDGIVQVSGQDIIFIHYSPITITDILNEKDEYLTRHWQKYKEALLEIRTYLLRNNQQHMISCKIGDII